MKRKFILLMVVLLLISVGLATAQSSTNYMRHRFVMVSGGESESTNYGVTSVIGQAATDWTASTNHKVSGGFLQPQRQEKIFLPVVIK